jgi:hypothetical protein
MMLLELRWNMFPFRLLLQDGRRVFSLFSGHSLRTGIFQSSNQTLKADDLVELGMIDIYVEMQCEPRYRSHHRTPFRWAKSGQNS